MSCQLQMQFKKEHYSKCTCSTIIHVFMLQINIKLSLTKTLNYCSIMHGVYKINLNKFPSVSMRFAVLQFLALVGQEYFLVK